LSELPQEAMASRFRSQQPESTHSGIDGLDGVEVTDIDTRARQQLTIPNNIRGALVSNVDPDSNSAKGGLQVGDVILEIDRHPVKNAEEAVLLSDKAKGDRVLLRVWSSGDNGPGGTHYIAVNNKKK
jgi:serine protease Do